MILTVLGLLVWTAAHLFKRLAPAAREKMGDRGRGIFTALSLVAIVLMVIGYRGWDGTVYWGRSPAMTGINNLLMLLSFYLFAASGSKTRITRVIRHPQLAAVMVWSVAHILVNGDTPSFVLFGGLFLWALVSMSLINRAVPEWTRNPAPPMKKELIALGAAIVATGVVGGIHALLGYNPFG
jgi:uncharacterized membrane protein